MDKENKVKKRIKLVRNLLGSLLLLSSFGLFAQGVDEQYALNDNRPAALSARPKYVFVFVGDGMSYPQVQSAADFLGKDANGIVDKVKASSNPADSPKPGTPSFLSFPVAGSAQTYDATSFAPDSASTATSIFTGHKTHSSSINVDIAKRSGYTVCFTQKDASALKEGDKAIVIAETLADSGAFSYEEDRKADEWALSDYVKKGIEVLDNPDGFFMMVEGGKIDWACHANDARSTIADTIALSDAVAEAVKFQQEHPSDTLILVTADHETGGLTIGYAGTDYNLFFRTLDNQTISYAKFDSDYVSRYKKDKTSFEDVMADVEKLFGLKKPGNAGSDKDGGLVLTDYEYGRIRTAYEKTMSGNKNRTQEAYELYGIYEPLTVTLTHVLNHKSGIGFTSYSHPGLPVPVFAQGPGQELFAGYYDNTDIYKKLAALTSVQED